MERWEIILQFMVGSPSAVSQDLAQLLVQAGLMKRYAVVFMSHSHFTCNAYESKKIQDRLFATCIVVQVQNTVKCVLSGSLTVQT